MRAFLTPAILIVGVAGIRTRLVGNHKCKVGEVAYPTWACRLIPAVAKAVRKFVTGKCKLIDADDEERCDLGDVDDEELRANLYCRIEADCRNECTEHSSCPWAQSDCSKFPMFAENEPEELEEEEEPGKIRLLQVQKVVQWWWEGTGCRDVAGKNKCYQPTLHEALRSYMSNELAERAIKAYEENWDVKSSLGADIVREAISGFCRIRDGL